MREYDSQLGDLYEKLKGPDSLLLHEMEVVDFLIRFKEQSSDWQYRQLARRLFLKIWMKRLRRPTPRKWMIEAFDEELQHRKEQVSQFLKLAQQVPCWEEIVGLPWLHRHASEMHVLEATLAERRREGQDKVARLYDEAAEELERILAPTFHDLANIRGNRARAAEARGFKCLKRRPPDLEDASREFGAASREARRGMRLLRQAGVNVTPQYLWYLRYWKHVAKIGLLPMKEDFRGARRHVNMAYAYGSRLPTFPKEKYYMSLEDIDNQRLVLDAYEQFMLNCDLPATQRLLEEWLQKSKAIQDTGRYLRLRVRKLTVAFFLSWKAEESKGAKPQAEQLLKHLFEYIGSSTRFGKGELFIRETVRSLLQGQIDYQKALDRIRSVFILDSIPPTGQVYVDLRSAEEKTFQYLPGFFQTWLRESPQRKLNEDKVMQIFLYYARCVAEFWWGVYQKRWYEGRLDQSLSCDVPRSFAWTDWNDLLTVLTELARVFDTEPKLKEFCESIPIFQQSFLFKLREEREAMDVTSLRNFVVSVICSTQKRIFPHPVCLKCFQTAERARIKCEVQHLWQLSQHSEITLRPRLGPKLTAGSYYFLRPSFERIASPVARDETLYSALSFGMPASNPIALLVEGTEDLAAFQVLLDRYNPHWKAQIFLDKAEGVARLARRYYDFKPLYDAVITVADVVREHHLYELEEIRRKDPDNTFELNPDFEGVHPEALRRALKRLSPRADFSSEEITKVIERASSEKRGTIRCLKANVKGRELFGPGGFSVEEMKRKLAIPLAEQMISLGLCDQIYAPLTRTFHLAFGCP